MLEQLGLPLLLPGETFARPGLRFEKYAGMGHSSCPEELQHLQQWIEAALK
jgi:lysophospholipase-2